MFKTNYHIGVFDEVMAEPVLKANGDIGIFATFHPLIFWLNTLALLNILLILVTFNVFQLPIVGLPLLLNADAPPNISLIVVTTDVFQAVVLTLGL